jgi:hypothetical protein
MSVILGSVDDTFATSASVTVYYGTERVVEEATTANFRYYLAFLERD